MSEQRYVGRVALVTGVASGIGRTVAVRLAAEGAMVVGCDVDEGGLGTTAKLIEDDGCTAIMVVAKLHPHDADGPARRNRVPDLLAGDGRGGQRQRRRGHL